MEAPDTRSLAVALRSLRRGGNCGRRSSTCPLARVISRYNRLAKIRLGRSAAVGAPVTASVGAEVIVNPVIASREELKLALLHEGFCSIG